MGGGLNPHPSTNRTLLSGYFTDVRNGNYGISGEIVFTASVVLDAVGKQDHYDLRG